MDISFKEIKCPKCGNNLSNGTSKLSDDVQKVKICNKCDFWMIIIIPNPDYEYIINRESKRSK